MKCIGSFHGQSIDCPWDYPLRRYGHSKFSKMGAGRHLGFDVTRNSAIRSLPFLSTVHNDWTQNSTDSATLLI